MTNPATTGYGGLTAVQSALVNQLLAEAQSNKDDSRYHAAQLLQELGASKLSKKAALACLQSATLTVEDLPDGDYAGLQSGYDVRLEYTGSTIRLQAPYGVRGLNAPVTVTVIDGQAKF